MVTAFCSFFNELPHPFLVWSILSKGAGENFPDLGGLSMIKSAPEGRTPAVFDQDAEPIVYFNVWGTSTGSTFTPGPMVLETVTLLR